MNLKSFQGKDNISGFFMTLLKFSLKTLKIWSVIRNNLSATANRYI